MENGKRLHTLYQQAVFQAMQYHVDEVPTNAWLHLVMQEAQCWHCAKDYTAYVQASHALHDAIFAAISCHPRNENDLPILHVVHPVTMSASYANGDILNAAELHFDVVVGWFEEVGVQSRLSMDFADALLNDIDVAIEFYNALDDPIPSVIKNGSDTH